MEYDSGTAPQHAAAVGAPADDEEKGTTSQQLRRQRPSSLSDIAGKRSYVAIHKGRTVIQCVFRNWNDAQSHLDSTSVWKTCATLEEAEQYLGACAEEETINDGAACQEQDHAIHCTLNTTSDAQQVESPPTIASALSTPKQPSITSLVQASSKTPRSSKEHGVNKSMKRQKTATATKGGRSSPVTHHRKPHVNWLGMLERLKLYHETHGTFDIAVQRKPRGMELIQEETGDAKSYEELRVWLQEQNQQFENILEGRRSFMSPEKIQKLKEIGYEFKQTSFQDYFEQLQTFLLENPTCPSIPQSHPLCKWTQQINVQLQRLESGKNSDLTEQQAAQLRSTRYFSGSSPTCKDPEDPDWDSMYERLKEYKKIHGDCLVNTTNAKDPLVKWVLAQRRHYLRIEEGGSSSLCSTKKLMKLHAIGFVFRQKGKYMTFEERLQELKDYKAQHGNLRVSTGTPGLGAWVSHVREQYRLSKLGRKNSLNDEKFQMLIDIGFEFKVGKTPNVAFPRLSWDQRFLQLLEYKEEYGDTVVPQHFSGYNNLGAWVKTQRGNYRRMKKGAPTAMTTEMALKLSEIGFAWEVSTGKGVCKQKHRSSKPERPGEIYSSSDSDSEDEPVSKASVGMLALGTSSTGRIIGNSKDESRRYYDLL